MFIGFPVRLKNGQSFKSNIFKTTALVPFSRGLLVEPDPYSWDAVLAGSLWSWTMLQQTVSLTRNIGFIYYLTKLWGYGRVESPGAPGWYILDHTFDYTLCLCSSSGVLISPFCIDLSVFMAGLLQLMMVIFFLASVIVQCYFSFI